MQAARARWPKSVLAAAPAEIYWSSYKEIHIRPQAKDNLFMRSFPHFYCLFIGATTTTMFNHTSLNTGQGGLNLRGSIKRGNLV